jgi:hypothetical protein
MVVYKNLKPWKIINGESLPGEERPAHSYKIRIEMGWGNNSEGYDWDGRVKVNGGTLQSVESCFRGRSVLAPSPEMRENPDINALDNRITEKDAAHAAWKCTTVKNPTTLHSQTNALILEVQGDRKTTLEVNCNGKGMTVSIGDLLEGSRSFHMNAYNSEAVVIHCAVPETQYCFKGEWTDSFKEEDCDVYHVEIRQVNGQCAWISPVFVLG